MVGCELAQYGRVDGTPVELIPAGGRGLLVGIVEPEGTVDLAETEFSITPGRLTLGPGERGSVRFRATLGNGRVVEKVMDFDADRYGFALEIRYRGWGPDAELLLRWDGGVAVTEGRAQVDLGEARVLTLFNGSVNKVKVSGDDKPERWED